MKKLFLCFILISISFEVFAVGENCYQIGNSDSKNFCLGTAKQDKNYCYQISDSERKNFCLAVSAHDKNYCYQISNSDKKNQCLGQF